MLVSFRSIVIAAKAVLLNLLSVAAAYGILVMVFQHGWGKGLLGFEFTGGIDPVPADPPVRDPLRPVDGLPRLHPQPDPRGPRPGHEHRRRDCPRDQDDGRRRHERRDRDGRGVLRSSPRSGDDLQAVRRRARGGDPDRRDDRPSDPPAGVDEAARRVELVPAEVAGVDSAPRARGQGRAGRGATCADGIGDRCRASLTNPSTPEGLPRHALRQPFAPRSDLARFALGVVALHVVDDNFLQPKPGHRPPITWSAASSRSRSSRRRRLLWRLRAGLQGR